jgi:hypothetical protein
MVRQTVAAAAEGLAERNGVALRELKIDDQSVQFEVELDRIEAYGFGMELRRSTDTWYSNKFRDGALWGTAPEAEE